MSKTNYKIAYENVMIANKMLEQEIERLNNIINELEKWLKGGGVIEFDLNFQVLAVKDILNKLQELKENKK